MKVRSTHPEYRGAYIHPSRRDLLEQRAAADKLSGNNPALGRFAVAVVVVVLAVWVPLLSFLAVAVTQ
jgi:hypothetical protein